jgi:hypothetical protein
MRYGHEKLELPNYPSRSVCIEPSSVRTKEQLFVTARGESSPPGAIRVHSGDSDSGSPWPWRIERNPKMASRRSRIQPSGVEILGIGTRELDEEVGDTTHNGGGVFRSLVGGRA